MAGVQESKGMACSSLFRHPPQTRKRPPHGPMTTLSTHNDIDIKPTKTVYIP